MPVEVITVEAYKCPTCAAKFFSRNAAEHCCVCSECPATTQLTPDERKRGRVCDRCRHKIAMRESRRRIEERERDLTQAREALDRAERMLASAKDDHEKLKLSR